MGSSLWWYTVVYESDANAALQQLRQQVYERGEYYRRARDPDLDVTEAAFRASLAPRATDPERHGAIVADFGTVTPSANQVEEWMSTGIVGERGRWVGTYIISYDDGQPAHIHFGGHSGD